MRLKLNELSNYELLKEYNKETSMPSVYQIGLGVVFVELLFRFFRVSFWITIGVMFLVVIAMMFVENKKFNKRSVLEKELIERMTTQKTETKKSGLVQLLEYIEKISKKEMVSYEEVITWAGLTFGYTEEYTMELIELLVRKGELIEPRVGKLKRV